MDRGGPLRKYLYCRCFSSKCTLLVLLKLLELIDCYSSRCLGTALTPNYGALLLRPEPRCQLRRIRPPLVLPLPTTLNNNCLQPSTGLRDIPQPPAALALPHVQTTTSHTFPLATMPCYLLSVTVVQSPPTRNCKIANLYPGRHPYGIHMDPSSSK